MRHTHDQTSSFVGRAAGARARRSSTPKQRGGSFAQRPASEASEREHLADRLAQLSGIPPALAQELAGARRQAGALRVENRRLLEEVRRLRAQRGDSGAAQR